MRRLIVVLFFAALLVSGVATTAFAQSKKIRTDRNPPAFPDLSQPSAESSAPPPAQPTYEYFSILDGLPMSLALHHDTEVGTNNPIDVYVMVIELQVMNSDGDLEPEGLDIFNFYTAKPQNPDTAPNPHNAKDCRTWNKLINQELQGRGPNSPTWPYIEFTVAAGARRIQTNEDGQVFWSDDVECWGSRDRFPPF
jgi:hypothetical protein